MNERTMNSDPVLALRGITRTYRQGEEALRIFAGADLDIYEGQIVALVGPSGSGKSSLLHIAGLLEAPNEGEVWVGGVNGVALSDTRRTAMRRSQIGFVYQFHNLLPEFSAIENVILPQMIAGVPKRAARDFAMDLLTRMGLGDRADHRPAELSGGEQQRVAIARALANRPRVLLADEPTGNLDPKTARMVFGELMNICRSEGVAALVATHNLDLAGHMDRVVLLHEGKLHEGTDIAAAYQSL
ncbi:ABC transporter ATP-binding protein [Parvibaculum sp.]|uniref:ABC transporter ATP-binding protein n=1 Tax=Parvibaculum sp. TaxID=2024848 RepID=UPI00272F41A8|nr:ABC transporter ATP-binding protein [Parvibaculum sp.]MDP1627934.1 ABC transporter ATP-binding protein [Parvibaculum sp.]MDP2150932.1 ABC transporter ATP-binding protein [Parvibaculum sp.]MDP3327447.1 ABC transporter ATP-binding protein [Parvibaculum sp.]